MATTVEKREERTPLAAAAADAARLHLRAFRDTLGQPAGDEDHERGLAIPARLAKEQASDLVTDAVRQGVSAEEIAAAAGMRQVLVAQLIADASTRAVALQAALRAAQRDLDEVTEAIRLAAARAVTEGMPHGEAAEMYGVEWASPEWGGEAVVVSGGHSPRGGHH